MKIILFIQRKIFDYIFIMLFFGVATQISYAQNGLVEVMYQNFRISYHAQNEELSKIILTSLETRLPVYESFYPMRSGDRVAA